MNLYAYCRNNPIGIALGSVSHSSGSIVPGMSSYASAAAFSGVKGNSFADNLFSYDPTNLSTWFSYADSAFSIGSGISSITRDIKKLEHIKALEATGDVLMHLGYWINIYVAAYENYHDDSMTKQEKWVSFLVDANHITGQTVGGHFLGGIPVIGPILSVCVQTHIDYVWSGDFCIFGIDINFIPKRTYFGKTQEEWVKYWINSLFD